MGATNYRELDIWQRAITLCEAVYKGTETYPKNEQYGLVSQMRRASVSVSANIAEGFARQSNPDFKRFLSIAQGSLVELETHLELSKRFGYLTVEQVVNLFEETDILGRMLTKLKQNMR